MRKTISLVLVVLFVFSLFSLQNFSVLKTVSASESCNLFSDNFDRTDIGPNWTVVDDAPGSNWAIQDGQLYQNSNVYRGDNEYEYFQGTHIVAGSNNWTDYSFSVDITPTDDDGVGLIARYQDQNNYYRFLMVADPMNEGPFRRIDKIVNGQPFQVLAIDKGNSFNVGTKCRITFTVIGNTLRVSIDGVKVLEATDNTFKSGKVGLMAYACYAYFDNVCVSGESGQLPVGGAPKNLRATPGDNKVTLTWSPPDNTSNISGYYLYRSTQPGMYNEPAFDFPIKETTYVDENVENGTTYYYICKAIYTDKTYSVASNEVSVTPKASTGNISTPVFTDSFEGKVNNESSLTSPRYNATISSSNKISYVTGKSGKGVHLDSVSSYVGYSAKSINPEEGTIRFYFKPDSNIYTFYNTRQPEWKDYASNKPPFSGYLIDTVGYLPAFKGAFSSSINSSGDPNNKNISMNFQTFDGSAWSRALFKTNNDFVLSSDKFYDIALVWSKSEGTIKLYIDGVLRATSKYNALLSNTELFFIGHSPFQNYWPYGPHSLIGTYDELRIYNTALTAFGTDQQNPTPNSIVIKLTVGSSNFTVNGATKTLDSPPVIKSGRTLLPIRPVIESLGGTVGWSDSERKVTIKLDSTTIELWIDKKNAKVNGVTKTLDVPPQIINSRTMVPLRFVSENLGCAVDWDGDTKTVTITYTKK